MRISHLSISGAVYHMCQYLIHFPISIYIHIFTFEWQYECTCLKLVSYQYDALMHFQKQVNSFFFCLLEGFNPLHYTCQRYIYFAQTWAHIFCVEKFVYQLNPLCEEIFDIFKHIIFMRGVYESKKKNKRMSTLE